MAKYIPRLQERYRNEIIPYMKKVFKYKNLLACPRVEKVVINMGCGQGAEDIKILESAADNLAFITGQRPVITRAKKAIANFKIREGVPVGCKVTLRKKIMYEFLDRLISISLPRIRDFRGLSTNSFDQGGNFSFGVSEQLIFPEIDYDKVQKVQGMDIIINIENSKSKEESLELLKQFGFPFRQ
jgi:large subunit ribosomal protein L5